MAVRNILTRGFGPGAEIPFVVTRGYSIGEVIHGYLTASAIRVLPGLDAAVKIEPAIDGRSDLAAALSGNVVLTPGIESDIETEP